MGYKAMVQEKPARQAVLFYRNKAPRAPALVGEGTPLTQGWELEFLRSLDQQGEVCMLCAWEAAEAQARVEVSAAPNSVLDAVGGAPFAELGPAPSPPGKLSTYVIWDSLE